MATPAIAISNVIVSDAEGMISGVAPGLDTVFDKASIGKDLHLEADLTLSGDDGALVPVNFGWAGTQFLMNFKLFGERYEPYPTREMRARMGWYIEFPSPTAATTYEADLIGQSFQALPNTNGSAEVEVLTQTTGTLKMDFTLTADHQEWLKGLAMPNWTRFTKSHWRNKQELINDYACVYSEDRALHIAIRAWWSGFTIDAHVRQMFAGKFFAQDHGASDTPRLTLLSVDYSRAAVTVDGLSIYGDTKVLVTVNNPLGDTMAKWNVRMIKRHDNANEQTFLEDYDDYTGAIPNAAAGINQIAGPMYEPSTHFALVSGTKYEAYFHVKGSLLDVLADYMFLFVVAGDPGGSDRYTQTWQDAPGPPTDLPDPLSVIFTGNIKDYTQELSQNVVTTVADRLIATIEIPYWLYEIEAAANEGPWVDWATDFRKVSLQVREVTTPDELVYGQWAFNRDPITGDFPDMEGTAFTYADDSIGDIATFMFSFRNAFLNQGSLPDFGGKDIRLKWGLTFEYALPWPQQMWSVRYEFEQHLAVNEFENFAGVPIITAITMTDALTGLPIIDPCEVDHILCKVETTAVSGSWKLMAMVDKAPFGTTIINDVQLEEEEVYASAQGLEQKSSTLLYDVDEDYDGSGVAYFKLDVTQLPEGQQWRVYAIIKPA